MFRVIYLWPASGILPCTVVLLLRHWLLSASYYHHYLILLYSYRTLSALWTVI